ncbi:unnamed protein product [Linum tenue]|uniref:Uncharacterized protein n=1 Tax=Linum tenue TaxID=586396 RepID=A0AAV0MWU6_9ROSI|nr:unnamed protein product [Linum tenue]
MLQTPAFMTQYPWSTRTVPSSFLMSSQPPAQTHTPEQLLAMEEDVYEEQVTTLPLLASNPSRDKMSISPLNEIQKTNSNLIVIGKTTVDNDKDEDDNDPDDDDADNADESEGEEFEQETG